jgi:hypothetical protein
MPSQFAGPSRNAFGRLAIILLIGLAGCKPTDQVSRYTAPKDPVDIDTISDEPEGDEPPVGVLGAIAPTGKPDTWYFFKFQPAGMGVMYPPKALARHKEDFMTFLKSVKFPAEGDGEPTWTLPKGWKQVEVRSMVQRIATLRMKKSETVVDLAVSEARGSLIENINRWRVQQVGIDPITEAEIETKCQTIMIDGRKVIVVDISGPGVKAGPPIAK